MSDIAKCSGIVDSDDVVIECPFRSKCLRFTSTPGRDQSWFAWSPYQHGECEFFWLDNAE
jgi:hypothetical protein